ncbi:hypothetical protein OTU49_016855 [Cherax quadricarinatus]|uniref:C-type lectin domain-containing protein n=2 Tax=Cherax quadricarinatus TaxID=27406 RepID=A0AAW0XR58_CHEQU|nr:C-type lectin domain family 4 member D-like [Cherax quadricarinatus]
MVYISTVLPVVVALCWDRTAADTEESVTTTETELRGAVVINQLVLQQMGQLLMDFVNISQHPPTCPNGCETKRLDTPLDTQEVYKNLTQEVSHTLSKLQEVTQVMTETFTKLTDMGETLMRMQETTQSSIKIPVPHQEGTGSVKDCPVPYFRLNSECFYINEWFDATWVQANDFCRRIGGSLAAPSSVEILVAVMHQRGDVTKEIYWLGASDLMVEQRWQWTSGTLMNIHVVPWKAGEPNNAHNEDCLAVQMKRYPFFNDQNCEIKLPFVCELNMNA